MGCAALGTAQSEATLPHAQASPTLLPIKVSQPHALKAQGHDADHEWAENVQEDSCSCQLSQTGDSLDESAPPSAGHACSEKPSASLAIEVRHIAIRRLFLALDTNGDGAVDSQEYWAFLRILGVSSSTLKQAQEVMAFKDLDNNGLLSIDDLIEACRGLDAPAICRLCEPLEREAGLEVYQAVQVEPQCAASPWLAGRCTGFCTSRPPAEIHELIVSARAAPVEPVGIRRKSQAWPIHKWHDDLN